MDPTLEERTRICVQAADSRQADDIVVLDMTPHSSIADRFVVCQGRSDRQVKAIADAVEEQLGNSGEKPRAVEGYQTGSWILIDYVDLVVHVFDPETREFYGLERLWGQINQPALPEMPSDPPPASKALLVEER
ncbi:MAG: ribosome silencing factor [Candidatus Tectomicrobia bacterium]|nr:ribosome silencing factor [Candidatus Tectomicrobia bacterium]